MGGEGLSFVKEDSDPAQQFHIDPTSGTVLPQNQ